MILAIDTSGGTTVGLVDDGANAVAERSSSDSRRHAEVVGSLIVECLADARARASDVTAVAVGMGPGPFTGLRVGIAAAEAFGLGRAVPVLRVVSHDAIASSELASENRPLLVVTDARRREVYWSTYSGLASDGVPERADAAGLCRPADLESAVPDFSRFARVDDVAVSAVALGVLAARMRSAERQFASAAPLYLRSPDVTVSSGPKRVTS
ncbi:tRNA (adenosine(37)-N6)-threonylcarbamoyltransferase complex dimerization subunit type 1 TsaB [Marisediminicola sp. LYQ134]|uniref:tRNA (adenosine(37)-N6)-threonylcarbamoyltransferase complex dimerization subunit type 1 TsaB n=1 Tax=Marisediminicola sp. LYQ134 TaxID=3391061 RepID=UPI003983C150